MTTLPTISWSAVECDGCGRSVRFLAWDGPDTTECQGGAHIVTNQGAFVNFDGTPWLYPSFEIAYAKAYEMNERSGR